MAHAVQKVVQRCEDCENNGGSMGKIFNIYLSFSVLVLKKCLEFKVFWWNLLILELKNKYVVSYPIPSEKEFELWLAIP